MSYTLRPYQAEASAAGLAYLQDPTLKNRNGIIVQPTGSGKSIVIADIVTKLDGPAIVLQPSKEILQQNLEKLAHYGYKAAVFSASMGRKEIGTITLGTIGTVISHIQAFSHLKYVLIDEAHVASANGGMYDEFLIRLSEEGRIRILGLTATPYRLASNSFGSELRFLTRSRPRIFRDMIFETPIRHLVENGYWTPLEYRQRTVVDRTKFKLNTKGSEYTDDSVQEHLFEVGFVGLLQQEVERALDEGRKNVLVFTRFVDESRRLAKVVPGTAVVTAQTPPGERAQILSDYKRGKIRVVSNVGVIALGFDFPELECVILGRPTISLANYYQSVGRAVRTHPAKQYAEIVDMVGLTTLFGKVEDLTLQTGGVRGESWVVCNQDRPLTNVFFHAYGHGSTRLTQQEILKANWRRKFWAKRKKKSLV